MNQATSEVKIAGNDYRVGKLNALAQFHVTRRLGPMLVVAGISVDMLSKGMKVEMDDMVAMAGPVMQFLAKMSDEDTDYCIFKCLGVVQRLQGSSWAALVAADGKTLMFADLDMPVMIRLVLEVLKHNLGGFLEGLGDGLTSPSS
jgi:hypothetical protein